jgi:glycerol dehydrogenase-like iron-containing ADH family enzyme
MSDTPKTDVALPTAPSADAPTATYQALCQASTRYEYYL